MKKNSKSTQKNMCGKLRPCVARFFALPVFIILAILLVIGLCSCEDSATEGVASEGVSEARLEYLSNRVDELEQMLIDEKSNSYLNDDVLRRKISELEERIKELTNDTTSSSGAVTEDEETIPPSTIPGTVRFIYTVENGKAIITGYTGGEQRITIPATIDGYVVEKIADSAFVRTDLREIEVSEGIKYIGWFAFSDNTALRNVILPKSLQKADYGIFNGCSSALRITCHSNTYAAVYAKSYGFGVDYIDGEK